MKHNGKRLAALLLALALILSQSASALAYAGTWPGSYDAAGCPSEDARIRNDGKHFYNCGEYVEPGCTSSGYAVFTCVYCGDQQTRYYPPTGHDWCDWDENEYPTCTEPGEMIRFCNRCWQEETQPIPALGHDWGDWQILNEATCGVAGSEIRFCNRCGMEQTRATAALSHDWGPWQTEQAATCTLSGMEFRYCRNCWAEEFRDTPPLGHNWMDWQTIKPPTCTESGVQARYCARCQLEQTRETSPLNHYWGPWKEESPGTCVERRMEVRACVNCGLEEYRYAGYGDHNWGEWETVKAPTATEAGLEKRVCKYSADHVEEREIPPTGGGSATDPVPDPVPQPDPDPNGGEPADEGKAALLVTITDASNPLKPVYDLGDITSFETTITNVGEVDLELFDMHTEFSSGHTSSGDGGKRTLLKPGESTNIIGYNILGGGFKLTPDLLPVLLAPGSETEELAGVFWVISEYPGYKPGTDEVLCTGTASIEYLVGKGEAETPHGLTVTVSWDEGVGEGKRYEGAVIPLYFTCTNSGETPVRTYMINSGDAELQPGESATCTVDWEVELPEVEEGVVHVGEDNIWTWYYNYQNAEGNWEKDWSESNPVTIPLTYPDGVEPEPDKPELTLTFLYDDPAKDVYDPEDAVWADYHLINSGNVPLKVVAHFTSEGVTDYDDYDGIYDPGQTDEAGWGWLTIKDGITPGTETEDLLGTVTISYYYKGLDVDTGEELCRTQTITRTWKVGKPDEGPSSWHIPSLSAMTAEQKVSEGYESSDPAGYQLGEKYGTHLITENTGSVAIPAGTIHVYDPYDGWTDTYYGHDFEPGEKFTGCSACWNWGAVTEEDVARGYIYFPPVEFTWEDPDSGDPMTAYSNPLTLHVISKTGLLVVKGIAEAPANGEYFVEGEEIKWVVTVTNNSNEPITDVVVTDQGLIVGEFEKIEPGETVTCNVPSYTVTEYDAIVGQVSNAAEAKGTDLQKAEHTYMSNTVQVPTKKGSPVPLPPPYTPDKDPDPSTDTPKKDPDPTGDPEPTPGTPETPEHPGTPGGGEDPKGPIYGYHVAATLYKTTAHGPKNMEYYALGETIDYTITLTNTGDTPLENITVTDSLAGFAPIGTAAGLAPGESVSFTFSWTVTDPDTDLGYVVNSAVAEYTFGGGIHGTPVDSNPVYVLAGENGWIPGPGGKPGDPDGNTPGGLIPPVHFEKPKLPGSGEGPVSCELQLTALGDNGVNYTLHACAAHTGAAQNAEAAALTGDYGKACDIWSTEIETLYEALYEAGDSEGKAAVVSDRAAFNAYASAFRALMGDEAAAEMLRLYCAELCCVSKTAPERMPGSLLNDCAHLMAPAAEKCEREFSALNGSDADVTERYDAAHAEVFKEAVRLSQAAKYGPAQENAFRQILRRWQTALDGLVNTQYKAADKETRKLIASARTALDGLYTARAGLMAMLYESAPEVAAEALSDLYRNALMDFCGR